jgi:hypothetical protein
MWEQYRKTAPVIQIFIVLICIAIYWIGKAPPQGILVLFASMQGFAIIGAWWAVSLKRRINARHNALPLERKL